MDQSALDRVNLTKIDNNCTSCDANVTSVLEGEYFKREVPDWILLMYFVVLTIGTCVNLCVVVGLLRCKRKGILLLLLQLTTVDLLTTFVAVLEVLSLQNDTWIFSPDVCPLFSGSEILTNSLTLYLLLCLNFHIISVWNLYVHQVHKGNKNPLTSSNEDESNECLVTKNDSPTSSRTLTIDYRRRKNDVSVIFPSLLVWFICLSLSIPEYTLSSTIKAKNSNFNTTICAIVDTYYGQLLQNLLLVFRSIIPLPLIFLSLIILVVKFCHSKRKRSAENCLSKNLLNTQLLLRFCIALTLLFFLTSLPRNVFYIMHVATHKFIESNLDNFKTPPLHNVYLDAYEGAFVSMLHYSSILFRTLVYITFLPSFRKLIKNKIIICAKNDD